MQKKTVGLFSHAKGRKRSLFEAEEPVNPDHSDDHRHSSATTVTR